MQAQLYLLIFINIFIFHVTPQFDLYLVYTLLYSAHGLWIENISALFVTFKLHTYIIIIIIILLCALPRN